METKKIEIDIEIFQSINILDYLSERNLAEELSDQILEDEMKRRNMAKIEPTTKQEIINSIELTRDFLCDKVGLQHACDNEQLMRELERIIYLPF